MVNKDIEDGENILLSEFRREASNSLKNRENILNRIQNLLMFDALIITLIFSLYMYRYEFSGKYFLVVSMVFIIISMLTCLYYLVPSKYFVGFTTYQLAELKSFPKIDTEEIRDRIIFELGIDNILTKYQNIKLAFGLDCSIYLLFSGLFFGVIYVLFEQIKLDIWIMIAFLILLLLFLFLSLENLEKKIKMYKDEVIDILNRHKNWTEHVVLKKKWNFADISPTIRLKDYEKDLKNIASSIPYIVYYIDHFSGKVEFRINHLPHGRIFKLILPKGLKHYKQLS